MNVTRNYLKWVVAVFLAVGCGREGSFQHEVDFSGMKSDANARVAREARKQQQQQLAPVAVDQKKLEELITKIEPAVQAYYDSAGKLTKLLADKNAKPEDVEAAIKEVIGRIEAITAGLDPILKPLGVNKNTVLKSTILRNAFVTSFSKKATDKLPFLVLGIAITADDKGKVTGFELVLGAPKEEEKK